ncbi:MAG: lasso RiPP family leader peptide-containing protein [Nitrospiraceae bacterium]
MKTPKRTPAKQSSRKKRYAAPTLTVYGDLRRLTKSKGGSNCDGGGKPATRISAPNA